MTDLDRLEALARKATPGPWQAVSVSDNNDRWTVQHVRTRSSLFVGGRTREEQDAAFIAAANPAVVLELVERLTALKAVQEAAARLGSIAEDYGWMLLSDSRGRAVGLLREAIADAAALAAVGADRAVGR